MGIICEGDKISQILFSSNHVIKCVGTVNNRRRRCLNMGTARIPSSSSHSFGET